MNNDYYNVIQVNLLIVEPLTAVVKLWLFGRWVPRSPKPSRSMKQVEESRGGGGGGSLDHGCFRHAVK